MARMHQFIGLAALSFALTGCVTSTDKYTAVKLENESLRAQLGDAQSAARSATAERDLLKGTLSSAADGTNGQLALITNLQQQNQGQAAKIAELQRQYEEAL